MSAHTTNVLQSKKLKSKSRELSVLSISQSLDLPVLLQTHITAIRFPENTALVLHVFLLAAFFSQQRKSRLDGA